MKKKVSKKIGTTTTNRFSWRAFLDMKRYTVFRKITKMITQISPLNYKDTSDSILETKTFPLAFVLNVEMRFGPRSEQVDRV